MSILERADGRDWNVYARGCDASRYEKARALKKESIKPGIIVDLGSGTGIVEVLLSELFSKDESSENSSVIGLDLCPEMIERAKSRKKEYKRVSVNWVRNDVRKSCIADESVDTALCFSFLHEIYSDCGLDTMINVLRDIYRMLKPRGKLIIRGGSRPESGKVYLKFSMKETKELFYEFARDFEPQVEEGTRKKTDYKIDFKELTNGMIELDKQDCFEFLTKYFYKENWDIEVKERFGIYTPEEWKRVLETLGFEPYHLETHLIPYLENRYKQDGIELYKKVNRKYVRTDYPDSTMILVAEKRGNHR